MPGARVFPQHRYLPPPGATELVLVRHGQSQPAVEGQTFELREGQGDPALSSVGRAEAQRVCTRLAAEGVAAIYTSTLRRTQETAQPLAELLGMAVTALADLREVHLGEWEGGLFRQKVAEGDPVALEMGRQQRYDVIPGAEPKEAFSQRVRAAVEGVVASHPDQRVVLFVHGGTIGELLAQATGSEPFAFTGSANASISQLVVGAGHWSLRRFNDTTHLDFELGRLPPS